MDDGEFPSLFTNWLPLPSQLGYYDFEARARQIRADYPVTLRKNSFPLMTHIPSSFISPV